MKEEFLALTTHDLRSPLTVISGVINFFTSGRLGDMTPEQKNMVAMMERNTQSLIELVNDLLDASKLESGTMRLDLATIELRGARRRAARARCSRSAREKEIALEEDVPDGLAAAARRPRQAPPRPRQPRLERPEVHAARAGASRCSAAREGGARCASRSPTPASASRPKTSRDLFDKYEQARSRATRSEKGTGLGLYITRQLVELHGGQINVQLRSRQGLDFLFHDPNSRKVMSDES